MDFTRKHRDLIIHEVLSVNDIQVLQEEREEQLIQEGSLLAFLQLNGLRQERLISISTILVLMIVQKNCKQKRKIEMHIYTIMNFILVLLGRGVFNEERFWRQSTSLP